MSPSHSRGPHSTPHLCISFPHLTVSGQCQETQEGAICFHRCRCTLGSPVFCYPSAVGPMQIPRHVRASVSSIRKTEGAGPGNMSPTLSSFPRLGSKQHRRGFSFQGHARGPRTPELGPPGPSRGWLDSLGTARQRRHDGPRSPGDSRWAAFSTSPRSAFRSEPARRSRSANAAMPRSRERGRRRSLWAPPPRACRELQFTGSVSPDLSWSAVLRLLSRPQVPAEVSMWLAALLQFFFVFFQMRMFGFSRGGGVGVHISHPSSLEIM